MDVDFLTNKQVLFFSPFFFGYEKTIANKMREMGAQVDMYNVRSATSTFSRSLLKIHPGIFHLRSIRYYRNIINQNKDKTYDYIFVIKGDMLPKCILKQFRVCFPKAKLCLYLFDSVKNIPGIVSKFKFFDSVLSFDIKDCKQFPGLKLRPLFFGDQFRKSGEKQSDYQYDICFIGTIHSDRFRIIRMIQNIANMNGLKCFWFLYLQSHFIYYFYWILKREFHGVPKSTFSFSQMKSSDVADIIKKSRVILDVQHPKQTGLTMRTIEMIGMNKRIVTTNPAILEYDFYNSENIIVIDRKDIKIDLVSLKKEFTPIPNDIYEKYSLPYWIFDVLTL